MKNTFRVAALIVLFAAANLAQAQPGSSVDASRKAVATHRPKLPLQDALKLAEAFVSTNHIDISHYWLYRAVFILRGDPAKPDKDKTPGWHFWWVNDDGAQGNYVEIFVSMDGRCMRLPSM